MTAAYARGAANRNDEVTKLAKERDNLRDAIGAAETAARERAARAGRNRYSRTSSLLSGSCDAILAPRQTASRRRATRRCTAWPATRLEGIGFPAVFNIEADPRRGSQHPRHRRIGDWPLSEGDQRLPKDAGEVPQSERP